MKAAQIFLVVFLGAATAFITSYFLPTQDHQTTKKETAYDRVMRTGVLRCGYFLSPVFNERDPNTGVLSGIFYDLAEEIGKQLSLKVEWAE